MVAISRAAGADGCGAPSGCWASARMQVENNRTQSTATLADLWRLMQDIDGLFQSRLELVLAFSEKAAPTLLLPSTKRGEIESTFDPVELAEFLLPSWEGAIL
jgi:hypothetical protein